MFENVIEFPNKFVNRKNRDSGLESLRSEPHYDPYNTDQNVSRDFVKAPKLPQRCLEVEDAGSEEDKVEV